MISCDCSTDDGERPSICRIEWRKARKPHKCCECGDTIAKGQRYEHVSGLWDGNWDRHDTCATCVAIRERYCPHGWIYGSLAEQIEECLDFDYREVPDAE
ncbi:MAG: hypothetical protein WC565_03915 [Parcubacteria group bacterium]|jgi:hypothetical protein